MNNPHATFSDAELGLFLVYAHHRARRMTFRICEEGIRVTVPPDCDVDRIRRAVDELRPRLRQADRQRMRRKVIDLDYRLDADLFHLRVVEGACTRFQLRTVGEGEVEIVCPPHTDFADDQLQQWLRRVVEESLRSQAKRILPQRLLGLSRRHALPFKSVKVNSSTGRWGSCSSCGNINLSCYTLLLPVRLMDYVMLHELAHTREMNHGAEFKHLLDRLTGGHSAALESEMKGYHTGIG